MDWAKATTRRDERQLSVRIWCVLYKRLDGTSRGPFQSGLFARNSNLRETSPSMTGHRIATFFCPCHDNTAVVPCTKFSIDHCVRIEVRVKRNLPSNFNCDEENVNETNPDQKWSPPVIAKLRRRVLHPIPLFSAHGPWICDATSISLDNDQSMKFEYLL